MPLQLLPLSRVNSRSLFVITVLFCFHIFQGCSSRNDASSNSEQPSTIDFDPHLPENALKGLTIAGGLEVKPFATEPMLINPTNMDVDDKGRVWITEAYNYRPEINRNPTKPEGDRIMILEDLNNDGRADTAKVFYQGPEINAPLGVCVLGNRVIISQSPYVWSFYDDDGDDKADRKEIMFQGIGGVQHDHGVHSFIFGPDGKLYFTFGNAGETLRDKNGKVVKDQDGDEIGPKKYTQGMLFRCNTDGSGVEVLGDNFRNNYEAAVDSYGGIWQSDNDDDGNRGTRINYILPYGNYGYTDEITGAGWQASRTNMEDSIPLKHWHLNDPGVVPNLLQTFAGSPTGMVIYEGTLLPKKFQEQMIHCDAGPNVVRSYPVKNNGAGYSASIENILKGEKDQWFRPADITIAPDGSLFIADWYDPGVGGHQAGDQQRGRVYRVAPNGHAYTKMHSDYNSVKGALDALQNPNGSTRYQAFSSLLKMGEKAVPSLEELWQQGSPVMRARAFWVLVKMKAGANKKYFVEAVKDNDPHIRMMAVRAAKQDGKQLLYVLNALVHDADVQVRRECAIALHHVKRNEAAALWATLAAQHDGNDRWYLEALGIGAEDQWDKFYTAYVNMVKDPLAHKGGRDITWRARSENAVQSLAMLANDQSVDLQQRLRYFRAFDFHKGPAKNKFLVQMLENRKESSREKDKLILHHLDPASVKSSSTTSRILNEVIDQVQGSPEYVELVKRYGLHSQNPGLLKLAIEKNNDAIGRDAAGLLLEQDGISLASQVIDKHDSSSYALINSLSRVGSKKSIDIMEKIIVSSRHPAGMRKYAAQRIGKSWGGEERVLELLAKHKVTGDLIEDVVESVSQAWRGAIRDSAASYLPETAKAARKKDPTMNELATLKADASNGKKVFIHQCALCHTAANEGKDFGPSLKQIGAKLPKEGLLDAILHPSAGINFGYEGWQFNMKDGSVYTGIVASKTETDIVLKYPGGSTQSIKTADVKSSVQQKESMMPAGLQHSMSRQEMADLLEFLKLQGN